MATTSTPSSFSLSKYFPFTASWFGLFILAGGIPLPPFSYLGFGGLNLWAAGSLMWFVAKAAVQGGLTLANTYITVFYPSLWWVGYLLVLNPWYVFDLVQMFSPAFAYEGYKIPFTKFNPAKPISAAMKDASGNYTRATGQVNAALFAAALALAGAGTYGLVNMLPPVLTTAYKPILDMVMTVFGGITAVAGGGAGMMMLPNMMSSFSKSQTEYKAAVAAPVQAGGGDLPTLADVADKILNKENLQTGGAIEIEDASSMIFVGSLTLVTLAGISLALVRSKGVSAESI
jgi:hypothetical protein